MNDDHPGLFTLPEADADPAERPRRPPRGRNRETWALTATADVTIVDADAVLEAFQRAEEDAITIGVLDDLDGGDDDPEDTGAGPTDEPFDALAFLVWPTAGLEEPIESGAVRVLSVESEVARESCERGTVTWTVTVKLTNVQELRRLAVEAHPDEAAAIGDSLAVAWQRAADPFAPLCSTPGISWRPGQVEVRHLPRRA